MALKKCKDCGNQMSTSAAKCPQCGKPQTSGCLKFFLIFIGVWIFIAVMVSMYNDYTAKAKSYKPPAENNQNVQPAKPQTWVKVHELSGRDLKNGPTFNLSGSKARIKYSFKDTSGLGVATLAVYVLPDGHDLMKQGGFPDINASGSNESDETYIHKSAGSYYLSVNAIGKWSIVIEELK